MSILGSLARVFKRGAEGIGRKASQFGRTAKRFVHNPGDTLKSAGKDIANGALNIGKRVVTKPARMVGKAVSDIAGGLGSNRVKNMIDASRDKVDRWNKKDHI